MESGATALLQGFTLEVSASVSAALERFYEFALKVMCEKTIARQTFTKNVPEMSRYPERQLDAFMLLYALSFGEVYKPDRCRLPLTNRRRPRTDPSEPDPVIRLLPRVCDGEAHIRPGMKDARLREPVPNLRDANPKCNRLFEGDLDPVLHGRPPLCSAYHTAYPAACERRSIIFVVLCDPTGPRSGGGRSMRDRPQL